MTESRRTYNRFDPLCAALEEVGDRWTLIIVRALMNGPQRYTDLKVFVRGSGSNVLAERLRRLADAGVVTRTVGTRAGANVTYQLTDRGWALAPVIETLVRFGLRSMLMGVPGGSSADEPDVFDASWALSDPGLAKEESYEWVVDGEAFTLSVVVQGLQIVRTRGHSKTAVVKLETTTELLEQVLARTASLESAAKSGRMRLKGSPQAVRRMFTAIGFPPDQIESLSASLVS